MLRETVQKGIEWGRRVVTQPREELTRWQAAARYMNDVAIHGARQLSRDRAPQMAAALSFRTLFGLIPVLVLGTIIMQAFRGIDQFRARLGEMFDAIGLGEFGMVDAASGQESTLTDWLLELLADAESLNVAAIGWIGVLVLIYSAVSLMATIENSFNNIYRALSGRSWRWRFPIYWFVLTIGPLAIVGTFYANSRVKDWFDFLEGWTLLMRIGTFGWSIAVTTLLLFIVYRLMPNAAVASRPAAIGAFIATIIIEIGRRTMGAYLENAISIRQLYGSLGLIPLAMMWIYLMWLVVLFGLEVSVILQTLGGRRVRDLESERRHEERTFVEPNAVIDVIAAIIQTFDAGTTASVSVIADRTRIDPRLVARIFSALIEDGLVHPLQSEEGAVAPARPPEQIRLSDLLEIGFQLTEVGVTGAMAAVRRRLHASQIATIGDLTSDHLRSMGSGVDDEGGVDEAT